MRRIALSLVTVFAVVAMVAGATKAVFSDSASFVGNTIATATVNISANSEPGTNPVRLPKPLNVTGLVPNQWTGWARGVVYNEGNSTNVRAYMYIDNPTGVACAMTNIQVWTGNANSGADSERGFLLMNGPLSWYTGSGQRVEITGDSRVFVAPNYLPANTSAVIQQAAQLDPSASNSYQNTSCVWNEVFVAESIY
jgi:hypothetical protein